jgi:type I restriction enzyme, S subunit
VKDITSKYSGYDWLGDIPRDWIISKNRYYFKHKKTGKNESNNTKVLSLTTKGVKVKENLSFGKSTESYIGHQMVEKGDIVFTPRDFDQTPILSDVSEFEGCISNLYIVDETDNRLINYFLNYYWYGLKYSCDYFKNFSHGMRYSFNRFQFDEIPLLIPPVEEQQQITSFLDTKTSLIDSLIDKTQRKIELLKEKRTSLINEVVTKGLNPNVEMKNSGVEWIGEIPIGWSKTKISRFCEVKDGTHDTPKYIDISEDSIPLVTSNSFVNGKIDFSKSKRISQEDYIEINKRSDVKFNDVIMSMIGSNIGNKVLVQTDKPFSIKNVCLFKTSNSKKLDSKYLIYLIESKYLKYQVDFNQKGGGQPFLSLDELRNLLFPFPPISEQQQIVEYLDEQTQLIDKTISTEQKRIDLLKEYKQSLISEVVTGKKRVV